LIPVPLIDLKFLTSSLQVMQALQIDGTSPIFAKDAKL